MESFQKKKLLIERGREREFSFGAQEIRWGIMNGVPPKKHEYVVDGDGGVPTTYNWST